MLELEPLRARVVVCLATRACLDAFPELPGAHACRVAPDELFLVADGESGEGLVESAGTHVRRDDPDGLVVDDSDGWSAWSVRGEDRDEVLARLSVLPLPRTRPAFLQGAVAQVPARILVEEAETIVLVPSPVAHHLRTRILEACRDLSPRLGGKPAGSTASAPLGGRGSSAASLEEEVTR